MAEPSENFFDRIKVRYGLIYLVLACFFVLVGMRLFQLQVLQHDEYVAKANSERTKQTIIESKRGEIYMRSGDDNVEAVVMNESVWRVYIDPYYILNNYPKYKDIIADTMQSILGDSVRSGFSWKNAFANEKSMYVVVANEIDFKTAQALRNARIVYGKDSNGNDLKMQIPGYGLQETTKRAYPSNSLAAQVLGYDYSCMKTDEDGNEYEATCRSGAENAFDSLLSGTDGKISATYDINNVQLSIGDEYIETPAVDGQNVLLTTDVNIQRKVESILENAVDNESSINAASAIVLNPNNGEVMAMANYPGIDLNDRSKIAAGADVNRVTSSPYEPASTCKPLIYATAIDVGAITPQSTYYNSGSTTVADRTIYNANRSLEHTGEITFSTALDYSLNTGSVEVLRRIGGGTITRAARQTYYNYLYDKFGLGRATGFELGESIGKVYSPDEQEGNAVRYSNMTFGQGMSVTMLQTASAFASIVNGGNYYQPTIYGGIVDADGNVQAAEKKSALRQTVSASTSATMREMLIEVRSHNGGSSDPVGYNIGVKTGTAETYDASGKYTSDKTNASVIGFGGTGDDNALPEYVIMVRLDGNSLLWGSTDAVPIFTEISNYLIEYLRIAPSL